MLVLGRSLGEAIGVVVDDEPGGPIRCRSEDGVEVGVATVGDPLLVAVDAGSR